MTCHAPVVTLEGTPRERGRIHGEALRELVREGIERWRNHLARDYGAHPDEFVTRFLHETDFRPAIERWTPDLLEEVAGIADAAGLPFETVFAYQLGDEEWWYSPGKSSSVSSEELDRWLASRAGCSAIGIRSGENGAPILAMNIDMGVQWDGTQAVLRIVQPDGAEAVMHTGAGYLGEYGCNSHTLGMVGTSLFQLSHSSTGLPLAFVGRALIERSSVRDARAFLETVPLASAAVYVLGDATEVQGLETSANSIVEFGADEPALARANRPLVSGDWLDGDRDSAFECDDSRSPERQEYLDAAIGGARDVASLKAVLAERTVPLCWRPSDVDVGSPLTFGSLVMELSSPPVCHIAPGPPDTTPWCVFTVKGTQEALESG